MTRVVSDRVLRDANGDISDHLRNHIHLTNCIHLKNHMHKQSPILADRALIRDLMVLQRSRSLRDPSASPPWHSASFVDTIAKKGEPDVIREGGKSVGVERQKDSRRFSEISIPSANFVTSKVAPGEVSGGVGEVAATSGHSIKTELRDSGRTRRGGSSTINSRGDNLGENEEPLQDENGDRLVHGVVSGSLVPKGRKNKKKGKHIKDSETKTVSEQLNDLAVESEVGASSNVRPRGGHFGLDKVDEGLGANVHNYSSDLNKAKRRKFRRARRTRATSSSKEVRGQSELSVASNSVDRNSAYPKHAMDIEEEDHGEQNVPGDPSNGCGIPWNWSRIHYQGKTFLDKAGRSLSCGLSDSRLRKDAAASHGKGVPDLPVVSDYSESSTKSDAEAMPLLVEASGSQDSATNGNWVNDYSGELGIFAESLLKHGSDSDLVSEAQSMGRHRWGANYNGQHQSVTQKYMPRTFSDLMGQNLVSQALSNAVARKKVGLLYVFYGPPGTGKTSCARIFARALNCPSSEQTKPCGNCNSCITHDMGKSRNIREVGPVSNFDFQGIMDLIDNMIVSRLPSQYRVFIFDDCDTLSSDCWSALSKVIDRVPRRVVFVLVCSSLDVLPHMVISRCQKFFFPKLKDADIIYTLQFIASKEDVEIDRDAIKLIASRSDGSLRDAEMTLEQLSLLGQKISVPLVQELAGLISDERLIDLLDLALSADTVNTVKNLRDIMEAGVEPLALMSQLATVITDILAGSYDFTKERHRRKFFRHQPLSKENMERLRQALKTLSEAEKQLRMSNDKITWLTAALLQLAPEQQYVLPVYSSDVSSSHKSLARHHARGRDVDRRAGHTATVPNGTGDSNGMVKGVGVDIGMHSIDGLGPRPTSGPSDGTIRFSGKQNLVKRQKEIEQLWLDVLESIQNGNLKSFLNQEGKLVSISFGEALTVQLMFSSPSSKAVAEKFRGHILEAFESVLGSSVTIEIRCETKSNAKAVRVFLPTSGNGSNHTAKDTGTHPENEVSKAGSGGKEKTGGKGEDNASSSQAQLMPCETFEGGRSEIVELPASPWKPKDQKHVNTDPTRLRRVGNVVAPHTKSITTRRKLGEQSQSRSIVKSKVSLAHVIQQAEGCAQLNGWSKRKAVSIAEKLEQENLRLEPRTRSLLCWKASRVTRRKLARMKIRSRRPYSLMKLVSCGKCLSSKSPR